MDIEVIAKAQAVLNDPTVQLIAVARDNHDMLKSAAFNFVKSVEAVYDINQDKWCEWCEKNLTDEEKAYIASSYKQIISMLETAK